MLPLALAVFEGVDDMSRIPCGSTLVPAIDTIPGYTRLNSPLRLHRARTNEITSGFISSAAAADYLQYKVSVSLDHLFQRQDG